MYSLTAADQLPVVPLFPIRVDEPGIPGQRHGNRSAVRQLDPQRVVGDRHVFGAGYLRLNRRSNSHLRVQASSSRSRPEISAACDFPQVRSGVYRRLLPGDELAAFFKNRFRRQSSRPASGALPKHENSPAGFQKRLRIPPVSFLRSCDLRAPEILASRGHLKQRAPVSVPEASVNENTHPMPWHHDVRPSRQVATIQAEAKSPGVQTLPQKQFDLRVAASNATHVQPPLFAGKHIHRYQPETSPPSHFPRAFPC